MSVIECFTCQSSTWSHCYCILLPISIIVSLFFGGRPKIKIPHLLFRKSTKYKMKLFVVVVSVALVMMLVFATDSAAAPTDDEDTNDAFTISDPLGAIRPYLRTSSSSTKISSKHPFYSIVKSLVKLLTQIFAADDSPLISPQQ